MPGLFGFVDKCENDSDSHDFLLKNILKSLKHFDYFNSHSFTHKGVSTGFVSWENVSSDSHAFDSETQILATYEGVIYENNGVPIRAVNKALVVLDLFKKYGEDFVIKLNGEFNIFIHDFKRNVSYLFNDRFGHRHLYYYADNDIFMFSPEIKAFLNYRGFDKSLDQQGLSDFFVYSYQFADRTFFKNTKLLPPASILKKTTDALVVKAYWFPEYTNRKSIDDLSDCIDEGYELFSQSVNRCVGESQKLLVPLSGGLDSRLIMSVISQRELDVTPVTFGTKKCSDYQFAKQVTHQLGMRSPQLVEISDIWCRDFAEDLVWLGESTYGALGLTTQYGMARNVTGSFDQSLNGMYGGHVSFGSPYYNYNDVTSHFSAEERINRIRKGFNGHRYSILEDSLTSETQKAVVDYGDETIAQEWERSAQVSDKYHFRQDYIFIYNRIRRGMNNINQNKLFYNDKQPFASYELLNYYLSLSSELALDHFLYKEIYKKILPELASIPWQQTGLNLYQKPSAWFKAKKQMTNRIRWHLKKMTTGKIHLLDHNQYGNQNLSYQKNTSLQKWLEEILLSDRCLDRGYFSKQGLIELLDKQKTGRDFAHEIDKLVMFELWNRKFIDGQEF
jgi:hypothetical protein